MVTVPTPGRYYEVEFFADGRIEYQVFGPASDVYDTDVATIISVVVGDVNDGIAPTVAS